MIEGDEQIHPVGTIPLTQGPSIPDKLQNILTILQEYKTQIIEDATLNTQSPDTKVKGIINNEGTSLLNSLYNNINASDGHNAQVQVLADIRNCNTPWNHEVSTWIAQYITLLFIDCPLSLTAEHCTRMKNEAVENYPPHTSDGTPT